MADPSIPPRPPRKSDHFSIAPPAPTTASLPANILEEFLRTTTLFKGCDPQVAAGTAPHFEALMYAPGGVIVRAGAAADGLWLIYRGRATVMSVNIATGATAQVEHLSPGEFLGEIGSLLGTAHPHTVIADEATLAIRLPLNFMEALSARVPSFTQNVAKRLAMRVLQANVLGLRGAPKTSEPPGAAAAPAGGSLAPPPIVTGTAGLQFVECSDFDIHPRLIALVPIRLIHQHKMMPLQLNPKSLLVGMVQPRNLSAITELKRGLYGLDVEVAAISIDDFNNTCTRLKLNTVQMSPGGRIDPIRTQNIAPDSIVYDQADAEREAEKAVRVIGDEVIRWVSRIVAAAIERDASDVHIETEAAGIKVRFRVQGALEDWSEFVPVSLGKGIVARFKVLAGLDITERRLPQDGRIGLTIGGRREVDLRITTVPASRGEKIVLRVSEAVNTIRSLDLTFVEANTLATIRRVLNTPTGAIVIAGGTSSGKTATLYSLLNERRKTRPDTNITMVEDPIEYRLQGITQVQTNHTVGLGFPQVVRSLLRLDPDVIAIGDTRDAETARLALEAAITGHVVLTSLHANDAVSVLHRLESFGCERTLMAQALSMVLVQKLMPKLCSVCVRLEVPTPMMADALVARHLIEKGSNVPLPRPVGCEACNNTGVQGRLAVIESLVVNEEIRNALMLGQALSEIQRIGLAGKQLNPFRWYASYLMSRRLISAADAIAAVTD